jgi:pimeloyl-ACP methyl ester carboxylesterase
MFRHQFLRCTAASLRRSVSDSSSTKSPEQKSAVFVKSLGAHAANDERGIAYQKRAVQIAAARWASEVPMTEMPPLQYAHVNGIRMGYHEAGPKTDTSPIVLCHGWPEIAYSWRHQIKALSEAGLRVIAPDQRGYGPTDRPEAVEAYDIEHLTDDLVGLLDHLQIDKAIFVGHDWGGFVVWQMPLRHIARVAGVVGINTPHSRRAPVDPIAIYRKRFGESMYIVQFQDPEREPDRIFAGNVEKTFDFFMRSPMPGRVPAPSGPAEAGIGASPKLNLAFPQIVAAYDGERDPRQPILGPEEMKVYIDTFRRTGFTGGINWYRNITRNWERAADLDHVVRVPSLMIMAELDLVLPPSAADGMKAIVPDLEKHLVRDSGHWTPQEKPEEVSATILDWRRRRFG